MSAYYGPRITHEIIDPRTVQVYANGLPIVQLRETAPNAEGHTRWVLPYVSTDAPEGVQTSRTWDLLLDVIRDDAQVLDQFSFGERYPAYTALEIVPLLDAQDIENDADLTAAQLFWGDQHIGTAVLDERDLAWMILDHAAAPVTDAHYFSFGCIHSESGMILDLLVPRGERDRRALPAAA